MTQSALPHMREGVAIVNTASVVPYRGSQQLLDYSSTKGAIVAFTRALAESLVERKLAGLVEAIAGGLGAPSLQQALDDLEQRRAQLAGRLAMAPAPLPRLHPNLAEVYRRKVTELGAALRDPSSGAERSPSCAA